MATRPLFSFCLDREEVKEPLQPQTERMIPCIFGTPCGPHHATLSRRLHLGLVLSCVI
jgi:hypothetical protein